MIRCDWRLSRRDLLRRLGLGAAALPLLHATSNPATAATRPRRLLIIQMAQGYRQAAWRPVAGYLWEQPLPSSCQAFEGLKQDMVFLPDLTNPGSTAEGLGAYGVMFYGQAEDPAAAGTFKEPGGPTLDQVVANQLPAGAPMPGQLRSLHLGVQVDRAPRAGTTAGASHCFWRGAGQPIEPIADPQVAHRLLFGAVRPSGDPAAARMMARRQGVLDHVGADLEAFGKRLGTEDRRAIDDHLEGVRDLERTLGRIQAATREAVPAPAAIDLAASASYPLIMQAHLQLVIAAFRSGATSVATLQTSDASGSNIDFGAFVPGLKAAAASPGAQLSWDDLANNPVRGGIDQKALVDRWFMDRFARLLEELQAVPDLDGSLLNSTVVVIANDVQDGATRDAQKAPWILAGRRAFFKTGQCLPAQGQSTASVMAGICAALGVRHTYGAAFPGLTRRG
jgi:hypothetical protein